MPPADLHQDAAEQRRTIVLSLLTIVTVALAVILDGERLPRVAAGPAAAIAGVVLLSAR